MNEFYDYDEGIGLFTSEPEPHKFLSIDEVDYLETLSLENLGIKFILTLQGEKTVMER